MALPKPKALAATYNPPGYSDPWQCVEDYQRVLAHHADHPDQGSSAVASRLDLPRGRIRPWLNDTVPDVVRGIQIAEANGWLADQTTPETECATVKLAAWALSGGSLSLGDDGAHVYFSLDHDDGEFAEIAAAAGIDYTIVHEDSNKRATEARPTTDGSVFARVLASMGVPKSSEKQSIVDLPNFLNDVDDELKTAFAKIVVANRGAEHNGKATVTIRVKRTEAFLESLTDLLSSVSGERVTKSGKTVTVSADAARALDSGA